MPQLLLDEFLVMNTKPPQGGGSTASAAGTLHAEGERFQLPEVIPTGERNNVLFRYGSQLRARGFDREEITVLLNHQNELRCDNPVEQSELDLIISQVCRYEKGRTPQQDIAEAVQGFKEVAVTTMSNPPPVTCLADLTERSPEWLIEGYVPRKEITVMAGDGGVGKTFVWCAVAAAISSGSKPFLLNNIVPDGIERDPQKVMYFSSEDSNEAVLLPRLKASGAALQNIVTIDSSHEDFQKVKLNSAYLEALIAAYKPALVIFDPLQSFLPPRADMSARNQMREAMAKLHVYGEKYGATFLIIMHTNKQQKVWGRTRLADSADIWDISRSVLICGEASDKGSTRYLSQEKSSYGKVMQTVLFRIDGNAAAFVGYTDKRDQQFVRAANKTGTESPERDAAEQFILEYLEENGESPVKTIESAAAGNFISAATLRRAKEHLREQQKITVTMKSGGKGKSGEWFVSLLHPPA
ncbi:MAG: AAA family ATPase [Clostridia bacterium]|nr:AAA family ATPase [Clostridia bacterium]